MSYYFLLKRSPARIQIEIKERVKTPIKKKKWKLQNWYYWHEWFEISYVLVTNEKVGQLHLYSNSRKNFETILIFYIEFRFRVVQRGDVISDQQCRWSHALCKKKKIVTEFIYRELKFISSSRTSLCKEFDEESHHAKKLTYKFEYDLPLVWGYSKIYRTYIDLKRSTFLENVTIKFESSGHEFSHFNIQSKLVTIIVIRVFVIWMS